ncbi:MAG: cytochrome c-type biogenesis protein [Janthinobacterium lividum]
MRKRLSQLVLICFVAFTMLGAGTPSTRFDKLGHKLMCPCSCAEILLECNHVGCPDSSGMIAEMHNQMDAGMADSNILAWFAAKYGSTVLASPMRGGFDLVAWVVPFAVLALGLTGIVFLLRLWQRRHAHAVLTTPASTAGFHPTDGVRDRIRRETTFEP